MASRSLPRAVAAAGFAAVVAGAVAVRRARRNSVPRPARPTAVLDVARDSVRFAATPEAMLPGCYSFWFADGRGHARVGRILEQDARSVRRELLGVDTGDLAAARDGRFNGWVHLSPAHLGVPWSDVRVQTTQGAVPAWSFRAEPGLRWAVLVHGRSSVRQEALRAVPAFHAAGWSVLLPAYRGDGEAPPDEGAHYGLTDGEWVDVESAVLHALDEGAEEVVLAGWSSGAAIVLTTAQRSRLASVVSGVVLDSPVLDDAMPPPAVPVLVLQSEDDGVAPPASARGLAAAHPELVRLVPFRGARHTRLWNLDRERWEEALTAWLAGDGAGLEALSGRALGTTTARRADRSRRGAVRRSSRRRAARRRS